MTRGAGARCTTCCRPGCRGSSRPADSTPIPRASSSSPTTPIYRCASTEPEHHTPKTYHATLTGELTAEALDTLRGGVDLPDGRTRPAQVRVLRGETKGSLVEFILTEGRNRQVRRMAATVGCKVRRLVRVAIGSYALGDLAVGAHRVLEEDACKTLLV